MGTYYYEKWRDDDNDMVVHRNGTHLFPAHFHANLEIFLLGRGAFDVSVNGKKYHMQAGDIAVADSYDIHSYDCDLRGEECDDCVLILPFDILGDWQVRRQARRIAEPILHDAALCEKLLRVVDLCRSESEAVREAGAGVVLALLGERLKLESECVKDERVTVRKILAFIQEHYREPLTRRRIAIALGYTEAHISHVFSRYLKTGICEYVNRLRLSYMERLRSMGDKRPVDELIFEAGFGSVQTYYRVKKSFEARRVRGEA